MAGNKNKNKITRLLGQGHCGRFQIINFCLDVSAFPPGKSRDTA
jgi:hypothetical protein